MKKKKLSLWIVILIAIISFIPFVNVYAEGEEQSMPIVTKMKTELASSSEVYLGEVLVDGESQMKWIYSSNILNHRFVFGNLNANLCNYSTSFCNLVPTLDAESENLGLLVSTDHQTEMDDNWISASYVANQYFTGTIGTEENGPVNNSDGHNGFLTELSLSSDTSIEEIDGVQSKVITTTLYVEETKIYYTKVEVTLPQIITYTVSFDANNGTAVTTQSVAKGSRVTEPANPVKEGYEFLYWTSDTGVDISDAITADTVFTAQWLKIFSIEQGADQTFYLDSDKDIIIITNGDYAELVGFALYSDNNSPIVMEDLIEKEDYVLEEGSTKLILKNSFLKTLSVDTYYVEFYYSNPKTYGNGYTGTTLLVKEGNETVIEPETTTIVPVSNIPTPTINNPKTGDNIISYILVLAFSIIGFIGVGYIFKRKYN